MPPSPKKRSAFWTKDSFTCALLASLLGTYLDLYFVGKGLYQFPHRLLPEVFPVNIAFTLFGLPIITMVILYCLSLVNRLVGSILILFVSLLVPVMEKWAEQLGFFAHTDKWLHVYSFFGYFLFFTIISAVYFWLGKKEK